MRKYIVIISTLLLVGKLFSQTQYPIPEFTNQPYWLDKKTNNLSSFEKVPLQQRAKAKGYAGMEVTYWMSGKNSSIRFPESTELRFVIKLEDNIDPSDIIAVYKFEINTMKQMREVVVTKRSGLGTSVTNSTQGLQVIDFKKLKAGIFEIVLQPLASGEYAFGTEKNLFGFGIGEITTVNATPKPTGIMNRNNNANNSSTTTSKTENIVNATTIQTAPNPDMPGLEQTVNWLIKNTQEITVEDVVYSQKLERETNGDHCKLKLTTFQTTTKGAGSTEVFTFNLKDLDPNTVAFSVKGKQLVIDAKTTVKEGGSTTVLSTPRNKLIHRTKDGQLLSYDDNIKIIINTPEKGNNYVEALKHAILHCNQVKKGWFNE